MVQNLVDVAVMDLLLQRIMRSPIFMRDTQHRLVVVTKCVQNMELHIGQLTITVLIPNGYNNQKFLYFKVFRQLPNTSLGTNEQKFPIT